MKLEIEIDWPSIHTAFRALDAVRRTEAGCFGYDGIADALGGSYFGYSYESQRLAGTVRLLRALQRITCDAWEYVHKASGKRAAAKTKKERSVIDAHVRAAVAVMLAAGPAYDLLADFGLCELGTQDIARGNNGRIVFLTGLHWLAGVREDREVTIAQAQAIVDGAKYSEVLSDRDEQRDTSWIVG